MDNNLTAFSESKLDRVMTAEQFDQIVEAIISGKYSWACVLILRFAGYNPLHYIPYRTYNRLTKDNSFDRRRKEQVLTTSPGAGKSSKKSKSRKKYSGQLEDLTYLEELKECSAKLTGGNGWVSLWSNFTF
ncbi:MAG: HetP family heterocyst commitment protein [Xenococcus sp. (in: cyanobacteria)]